MKFDGVDRQGGTTTCPRCAATVGRLDLRYPFATGCVERDAIGCVSCLSTADPGVHRPSFNQALDTVEPAPVGFVLAVLVALAVVAYFAVVLVT